MRIRRVTKRDGRTVPFDRQKIAAAVRRAQASVGADDERAAEDVADVVELSLSRRYASDRGLVGVGGEALPGIEEIQDLVEQALIELGHASVAKAYILYRDRRSRVRSALLSRSEAVRAADGDTSESSPATSLRGPRVQVSGGFEAWKKSRITAALMDEADLPRDRAEEVAARVEERVFALGVKLLSTALIRELVDNELVELGLSTALRRQRPVGVPRHDLRRILGSEDDDSTWSRRDARAGASGADVVERVAGEVLRRFALEDVLTPVAAEHHLSGEIHVEDLEHPHQALETSVPCDLLLRGEPSARSGFELLEDLADLARGASRGVVLEDAWSTCGALARARGGVLTSFLAGLAGVARASGRRVDLAFSSTAVRAGGSGALGAPSSAATAVVARVCEELGALEDEGRLRALPRLFLDASEITRLAAASPAIARTLDVHLARGRVVPTWSSPRARFAAPTLRRAARERGVLHCGGAVAINLPRAARRAGPWREDALLEHLATAVERALDALHELREFQRGAPTRPNEMRGRTSFALVPVGLREALRWLSDGEIRPEQGARVLGFLSEATERFAAARSLSVTLSPAHGERAAVRFAELDRDVFPVEQPLLFDLQAEPRGLAEAGARAGGHVRRRARAESYGVGFEIGAADPGPASNSGALGPGLAAVLASLDGGALEPPSILRALSSGPSQLAHPCLDALEKLERARTRLRNGAHALYALPRAAETAAGSTADGSNADGSTADGSTADYDREAGDGSDLVGADDTISEAQDVRAPLTARHDGDRLFLIPTLYPDDATCAGDAAGHVPARHVERGETSRFES